MKRQRETALVVFSALTFLAASCGDGDNGPADVNGWFTREQRWSGGSTWTTLYIAEIEHDDTNMWIYGKQYSWDGSTASGTHPTVSDPNRIVFSATASGDDLMNGTEDVYVSGAFFATRELRYTRVAVPTGALMFQGTVDTSSYDISTSNAYGYLADSDAGGIYTLEVIYNGSRGSFVLVIADTGGLSVGSSTVGSGITMEATASFTDIAQASTGTITFTEISTTRATGSFSVGMSGATATGSFDVEYPLP